MGDPGLQQHPSPPAPLLAEQDCTNPRLGAPGQERSCGPHCNNTAYSGKGACSERAHGQDGRSWLALGGGKHAALACTLHFAGGRGVRTHVPVLAPV